MRFRRQSNEQPHGAGQRASTHQSEETRIRCLENRLDLLEKRLKAKEGDGGCAAAVLGLQFIAFALYGAWRLFVG